MFPKRPLKRLFSRKTPLVAAIMKDEAPYIVEWVAWHKLQGFDLMVGDNCSEGPQTSLLKRLERIGLIAYVDCRNVRRPPQLPAYRKMLLRAFFLGYGIIGFLDADEFFEPLEGDSLGGAELVRATLGRKGIHACGYRWAIFGSNGHEHYSSEPVMLRFTRRTPPEETFASRAKSFASIAALLTKRPHIRDGKLFLFGIISPHLFHLSRRRYAADGMSGVKYPPDETGVFDWKSARIRHYAVKSREECRRKSMRGDVLYEDNKYASDAYWRAYDLNDIEDPLPPDIQRALRDKIAEIERALEGVPPQAK